MIVIYEATCTFCNWYRRFVEQRSDGKVTFIGYEEPAAAELLITYPDLFEKRTATLIALEGNELPRIKSTGCIAIAKKMRRPWPFLARVFSLIPLQVRDFGYDRVARNRHHLSKLVRNSD